MGTSVIDGNLQVRGTLTSTSLAIPASAISDSMVSSSAAITATKLQQQRCAEFTQASTMATVTQVIHTVAGATGSVVSFAVGSVTACAGAATCTVDLKKNGSTVLTAVVTLNSSSTAYGTSLGTLNASPVSLVTGDILTVVVTATAGGGTLGTGLWARVITNEDPGL